MDTTSQRVQSVRRRLTGKRLIAAKCKTKEEAAAMVLSGGAVAGYCGFKHSRAWANDVMGSAAHDVWYTERNGDPITLIVPAGTPLMQLPDEAMGYIVLEWIAPEGEFTR